MPSKSFGGDGNSFPVKIKCTESHRVMKSSQRVLLWTSQSPVQIKFIILDTGSHFGNISVFSSFTIEYGIDKSWKALKDLWINYNTVAKGPCFICCNAGEFLWHWPFIFMASVELASMSFSKSPMYYTVHPASNTSLPLLKKKSTTSCFT